MIDTFGRPERLAIGRVIEAEIGERRGRPKADNVQNLAQFPEGTKTRDVAAECAGFGNATTS